MTINTEKIKQSINLMDYIAPYTDLHGNSHKEIYGPCPKCGGKDRFHVAVDWFKCYQCHTKPGDAIEFVQWYNGVSFRQACEMLTSGNIPTIDTPIAPRPKFTPAPQPQEDINHMAKKAHYLQSVLASPNGAPGRKYLLNRGITLDAAKIFKLGYSKKRKAISMPWLDPGGNCIAIRYRHIDPEPDQQKNVSEKGSRFSSLYGYHTHLGGEKHHRTLIICEGELNAISAYQVTRGTNVDVLSVGSESTRIKDAEIERLETWGTPFLWMDKKEILGKVAPSLHFDRYINSPDGDDANDKLKNGTLDRFIVGHRILVYEKDRRGLERVLRDYRDAKTSVGIDAGIEKLMVDLSRQLGVDWVATTPILKNDIEEPHLPPLQANEPTVSTESIVVKKPIEPVKFEPVATKKPWREFIGKSVSSADEMRRIVEEARAEGETIHSLSLPLDNWYIPPVGMWWDTKQGELVNA